MNIYVGNLSYEVGDAELRAAFAEFGTVTSARVIMDNATGRSRGFGFVEMETGGQEAIDGLNGQELSGRPLTVNEARPKREGGGQGGGFRSEFRPDRGGRGGAGGGRPPRRGGGRDDGGYR